MSDSVLDSLPYVDAQPTESQVEMAEGMILQEMKNASDGLKAYRSDVEQEYSEKVWSSGIDVEKELGLFKEYWKQSGVGVDALLVYTSRSLTESRILEDFASEDVAAHNAANAELEDMCVAQEKMAEAIQGQTKALNEERALEQAAAARELVLAWRAYESALADNFVLQRVVNE